MSNVIGRVRLSKGRVGYFDELTRIHLTISRPEAPVYAGMNTANLKRAVRGGVLRLVAGSLELEQAKVVKDVHTTEATKAATEKVEEVVTPVAPAKEEVQAEAKKEAEAKETKTEEAKAEEVKAEEVKAEEVVEEKATEEAETKTTSRKRKPAAKKETANKEE